MSVVKTDVPMELSEDWPVMFTYHLVPEGSPVSVKVTVYVTAEKVTDCETVAPLMVNDPEPGDGLSIL